MVIGQEIEIKEAFALFDPTNSGFVQPAAIQDFIAQLDSPEFSKKVKVPTQPLDFKAFSALLNKGFKGPETSDEAYTTLFRSINKDGSGNVSAADLASALKHFGNGSLSEADVDEVVHEADVSGDGRITLEEFLKVLHKSEKKLRGEHVL